MNEQVANKIERLKAGEILISKEPGNSMEPILKSREPVILTPLDWETAKKVIKKGDIVFSKIHGTCYTHKVYAVDQSRGLLIGNNHGHENGYTTEIYAKAHLIPGARTMTNAELKEYLKEFKEKWVGYGEV